MKFIVRLLFLIVTLSTTFITISFAQCVGGADAAAAGTIGVNENHHMIM